MSLNTTDLKNTIIETLSENGFNFNIMSNHIVYDQVTSGDLKGTTRLGKDNTPIIIKEYDEPALSIMMESIASSIVDEIKTEMILDDVSNISATEVEVDDMLLYSVNGWINSKGYDRNIWNANKLQNRAISLIPPTDGQVLAWNSATNSYVPTTI